MIEVMQLKRATSRKAPLYRARQPLPAAPKAQEREYLSRIADLTNYWKSPTLHRRWTYSSDWDTWMHGRFE
jgi:hypothetical protein